MPQPLPDRYRPHVKPSVVVNAFLPTGCAGHAQLPSAQPSTIRDRSASELLRRPVGSRSRGTSRSCARSATRRCCARSPRTEARVRLICARDPGKGGDPLVISLFDLVLAMCVGRWTAVGVEVERPQRSEDERPRGRRGSAAYCGWPGRGETRCGSSHLLPPVRDVVREMRRACRRPALSGSTDDDPAT